MKNIRTNFTFKVITVYLALNMIFPLAGIQTGTYQAFALTGGPSQPEFNSFTPIGTSDMVDLASGDFNYNIPIMDVGGYPLNLSYNSGITMDQEASWVGLGWNLNVGQINRNVRGLPDDFDGDVMKYTDKLKNNVTIGTNFGVRASLIGFDKLGLNVGMGVQYNNYHGFTFNPSAGVSFNLSKSTSVGLNVSSTTAGGATVTPTVNFSANNSKTKKVSENGMSSSLGIGISFNSRQAISSLNLSASSSISGTHIYKDKERTHSSSNASFSGSISFNDYMTFTPSKRVGMENGNFSFSGSLGANIAPVQLQFQITGSGSYAKIKKENRSVNAFGYEHTYNNNSKINGVLDFNREKDRIISKNTKALAITNYTYDIYSIKGQGIGGVFKPFYSQVGNVYDSKVIDYGDGVSVGGEFGFGWNVHTGFDVKISPSHSYSSNWSNSSNTVLGHFQKVSNTNIDYEETYYKMIGDLRVDSDSFSSSTIFEDQLGGYNAIKIGLGGSKFHRQTNRLYRKKILNSGVPEYNSISINDKIYRNKRDIRNQSIQKITRKEAGDFALIHDGFVGINYYADAPPKDPIDPKKNVSTEEEDDIDYIEHHTAALKILKNDGSTYFYGNAVYNTKKIEATFDVSGKVQNGDDCKNGTISYNGSVEGNHSRNSDKYVNKVETPSYAYAYLLTSILSSDFEDLTENGPTDDDLGSYTKFTYSVKNNYKWRVPFKLNKAMYNEGLISHSRDQKGNYIYGEKQLQYINKIETKTHIAVFDFDLREDGIGVVGENGGAGSGRMQRIKTIKLYSKEDYKLHGDSAIPIKTAHFGYNYELCPGIDNNITQGNGKLTLKKVYFTYGTSKMGKYNPYQFNYADSDNDGNPNDNLNVSYGSKDYDVWGNYKENNGSCGISGNTTTAEFPFVEQDENLANDNVKMWTLSSVELPSGGKINLEFESDNYQYVQNKKVMQMFKVSGAGNNATPSEYDKKELFNGNDHYEYIYVEINKGVGYTKEEFENDYIGEHIDKPIYFRFLLNMVDNGHQFDYVSGYFYIDSYKQFEVSNNGKYVAIPLKMLSKESGWIENNDPVNPIAKAGWFFGRTNLNRVVYSSRGDYANDDFESIVRDLLGALGTLGEIFKGPNQKLQNQKCASKFISNKSWIRLLNPMKRKLGGGARVKKLEMLDNWDEMTNNNDLYKQKYGQEYDYNLVDGTSSGVATFEPNSSKENPFIEPFFNSEGNKRADKLAAPKESNYVEKPFGESFFPAATVTYSRVTVKNLARIDYNGTTITRQVKKHATGKVVNEFYTSKDFPTLTDYTDITPSGSNSPYFDKPSTLGTLLNISVRNHMTLSQGFMVHTNDMNGKSKSQRIYAEDVNSPISGVDYIYSTQNGKLDNKLPTIDENGTIHKATIGEHYDVVNDFRESYSLAETFGFEFNFAGFVVPFWFVTIPIPIPQYARHENKLNLATTTKVIHTSGILIEKIAYDLGASVSTKNLAWDAVTGQVLVTETKNEYEDAYYSVNYPAHWRYKQMGLATQNVDFSSTLKIANDLFNLPGSIDESLYFTNGDELRMGNGSEGDTFKVWVASVSNNGVVLMYENGSLLNDLEVEGVEFHFKLTRSGYRNLQSASMASITLMTNPVFNVNQATGVQTLNPQLRNFTETDKIINASAIEYSQFWAPQCECLDLPNYVFRDSKDNPTIDEDLVANDSPANFANLGFNPYRYNVLGNYKAVKSYAYLTQRKVEDIINATPRKDGFFTVFKPYYKYSANAWQKVDVENTLDNEEKKWTFASQVSKYSPYGVELENKDALNRYSSAQYGFNYTLPTAVSSNSKYTEMGYDSFEDYKNDNCTTKHFDFNKAIKSNLGNATISDQESHTGRKSIKVSPGTSAVLEKRIIDCEGN